MKPLKAVLKEATAFLEALPGSSVQHFDPAEIERARKLKFKSREKLIEMPIRLFLNLAKPGTSDDKTAGVEAILDRGDKFGSIPFLQIRFPQDLEDNSRVKVVGHEGRHRARALLSRGFKTMPVVLWSREIRWGEQNDPESHDYIKGWPIEIEAQDPGTEKFPFPVSREDAGKPYEG